MKSRNAILISALLVFGLLALALFLTIPEARQDTPVFWISFAFAIPTNFVLLSLSTVWGFSRGGEKFMRLPAALYTSVIFSTALLIAGGLYAYLDVTDVTWPIITFVGIVVFYVILGIGSVLGTGYMSAVENEVKVKRSYIKMLEADILDCELKSTKPEVQAALRALAEAVRFSDPMSHPSLAGAEAEISSAVYAISAELGADPAADVTAAIARTEIMLKSRNNRCMMLK